MAIGTQTISTTGRSIRVSADGRPVYKAGGLTIDWSTVTPVGSDTTLADGTVVLAGDSYLRYGQILTRITASGQFGPYASGASDGRQTLRRGDSYILDRTIIKSQLHALQVGEVLEGGLVFIGRITDVAGAPSDSSVLTAFPALTVVRD